MATSMGLQWAGRGGSSRAGSELGEDLQRHFHSDLKEGKGEEEGVALMERGR